MCLEKQSIYVRMNSTYDMFALSIKSRKYASGMAKSMRLEYTRTIYLSQMFCKRRTDPVAKGQEMYHPLCLKDLSVVALLIIDALLFLTINSSVPRRGSASVSPWRHNLHSVTVAGIEQAAVTATSMAAEKSRITPSPLPICMSKATLNTSDKHPRTSIYNQMSNNVFTRRCSALTDALC